MAIKKRINKKTCKSKKDDCPVSDSCDQKPVQSTARRGVPCHGVQ